MPSYCDLLLLLLALLAAPAALAQPLFDAPWRAFETADLPYGHFAVNLTAADLNGDGRPDAVTAQNLFFPGLRVFLNEGTAEGEPATFPDEGTVYALSKGSWDVEARDFDGDGDLDLLSTDTGYNYFGTNVALLRNNGEGTFAAPQSFPAGGPSTGVAAGDLDGDGDLDAAVANYGSFGQGKTVSVLRNNGGRPSSATASWGRWPRHAPCGRPGSRAASARVVHEGIGLLVLEARFKPTRCTVDFVSGRRRRGGQTRRSLNATVASTSRRDRKARAVGFREGGQRSRH